MATERNKKTSRKPIFIVQHEDAQGNSKLEIKYTGGFDKQEIQKGILFCVERMEEGDIIEYLKDDRSKVYAGCILMLSLKKKNGVVMREIMQGAHAGRLVRFNYFK